MGDVSKRPDGGVHLHKISDLVYSLIDADGAHLATINVTHVNFAPKIEALFGGAAPAPVPAEPKQSEDRYTNHYLCPNDQTRWDDDWSCMCNDRCPTCNREIEPYASTQHSDMGDEEVIHNQDVYNQANVIE